jgi:hypothetical protein
MKMKLMAVFFDTVRKLPKAPSALTFAENNWLQRPA